MDSYLQQLLLAEAQNSFSRSKRRRYVKWDREVAHAHLVNDYFAEQPVWSNEAFCRRFRMQRELFMRIVNVLESHDEYFHWRVDATSRKDFSPLQKCTVAIRQLVYGGPADHYDEYLRVAETTVIDCLFNFCRCVIEVFGKRYLRRPNADDKQRLLECMSRDTDSLAYWVALIVCIGNGETVRSLGKASLYEVAMESPQ